MTRNIVTGEQIHLAINENSLILARARRGPTPKRGKKNNFHPDAHSLILTEGFETLTVDQREKALAQLHGVSDTVDETRELVATALDELRLSISIINNKQRRMAYDKALFLNPYYVQNNDFRLMFLRSEGFDADKAADKMMKHFETKLELFGLGCRLVRDITFEDLMSKGSIREGGEEGETDAVDMLMSGAQWFTNSYDRSGRRIYLCSIWTDDISKTKGLCKFLVFLHSDGSQKVDHLECSPIVF